jgi:hypothetical protein
MKRKKQKPRKNIVKAVELNANQNNKVKHAVIPPSGRLKLKNRIGGNYGVKID